MIVGIGIDLTEQQRIADGLQRFGERFKQRLFGIDEIALCERYADPSERYAGKFAVKEATMKALGAGFQQKVFFRDIEVLNRSSGAPYLRLHGQAQVYWERLAVQQSHVTVTHSGGLAVAVVVLERMDG